MDLPVTIRGIRHVSYNVCRSTAGIAPNGCVQQKASATSVRNHHRIVYIAANSRLFRCEQQKKIGKEQASEATSFFSSALHP